MAEPKKKSSRKKPTHKKPQKSVKVSLDGWICVDSRLGPLITTFAKDQRRSTESYEMKFGLSWEHAQQHGISCVQVKLSSK